jgi:hypothetical protein
MIRTPKRPRDPSQLAKMMVDIASGEDVAPARKDKQKDPAAVARGRKGGLKGGVARAAKLSAPQRRQQAQKAAQKRWQD